MRFIDLDARSWHTVLDFYDALLTALEAPDWHGRNVNALIDSMIWGEINAVEPPYAVRVFGVHNAADEIREHIATVKLALAEARAYFRAQRGEDVAVDFEIES